MYRRRRRPNSEIAFSFDSFLDVVANVVGIILRLILVAWVGAKTYTGAFKPPEGDAQLADSQPVAAEMGTAGSASVPEPEPALSTDAENAALNQARKKLAEARAALLEHLRQQEDLHVQQQKLEHDLGQLVVQARHVEQTTTSLDERRRQAEVENARVKLSLVEIQRRGEEMRKEIAALEKQPVAKHILRYQTPVARTVQSDELHFECKGGRVTFLDVEALMREVKQGMRAKADQLKTNWEVTDETSPIGAFRLHYVIARERGLIESVTGTPVPDDQGSFRYGVDAWEAVPVLPERGEPGERALDDGSEFRRLIDHLDAMHTAVTIWVYPDSFPLYRQLRDYCVQRDLMVAGRPLPAGVPIASSRQGSASRGQ